MVTYFVASPFVRSEEGELVAGEAQDRQTADADVRETQRMALTAAGAVAFSRRGDPASGEFADAIVINRFGDVPDMDALLGRPEVVGTELSPSRFAAAAKSRKGSSHQRSQSGVALLARLAENSMALPCADDVVLRMDG